MKTYSITTRPMLSEAEALWRAANNELVVFRFAPYFDAMRAATPTVRAYEYQTYRLIPQQVVDDWFNFNPIGYEAGFVHSIATGGRIRNGLGFYAMNMGNAGYVNWQHANAVKLANGDRYPPDLFAPPPCHGVETDLTLWYENFDGEGILDSIEYNNTGDLYTSQCVSAEIAKQAALDAAFGAGVVRTFPNFGNLTYLDFTDIHTANLVAASPLIMAEVILSYTNYEPNLSAESCIARWSRLDTLLVGGREVLGYGYLNTPKDQAAIEISKIGTVAFFLMGWKDGLIGRYSTEISTDTHMQNWELNDLFHSAHTMIGTPSGAYTEVTGSWIKGKLFKRIFSNGVVYYFVRKQSAFGGPGEKILFSLGSTKFPIDYNGNAMAGVDSCALSLGQGAIFYNGSPASERVAVLSLTGTELTGWSATPPGPDHHLNIDEPYPPGNAADFTQVNDVNLQDGYLMSAGPNGMGRITKVNVTMLASGLVVTKIPAIQLEVVVNGVVYGTRWFSFDSGGVNVNSSVSVIVDIPANVWYAGPRSIRFKSLDGNTGYPGIPTES